MLGEVLRTAIADGKTDLAAAAATALGQVTDRSALSSDGRPHPLVEALSAPGARLQFAAAKALVDLAPTQPVRRLEPGRPHPGPVRDHPGPPRAVVIDGNADPGQPARRLLKALGYETVMELTGDQGFLAAAETADVELVLVSHDLFQGAWGLIDTLTNLKADARTANLPVYRLRPARPRDQPAQPADELPGGQVPGPAARPGHPGEAARRPAGEALRRRAGRLRPRGGRAPGPDRLAARRAPSPPT